MKKLLLFAALIGLMVMNVYTQTSPFKVDAGFHSIIASDELRPMWQTANQWGIYDQFGHAEALFNLGASCQLIDNKHFAIKAGLRGLVNANIQKSVLQEAYMSGNLWFIDFSLGKEQYSPIIYNDDLTTGVYLINSNARPVPKVTVGIFDYQPIGFLANWLEVKGGLSQGWLNDDRGQKSNSANDLLLHEKFAYARVGNVKFKPYAGLVHSALFGGTRPNGNEIPVDFWSTFFAKGSAKIGGGEETNVAGAHMGFWDFGFNWHANFGDIHFYWQKPFADRSGLVLTNRRNKDFILGTLIYPKNLSWLKGISVEVFRTAYQAGYGIPDPLYPVDYKGHSAGSMILAEHIEDDYDGFMHAVFPETIGKTGWTGDEVSKYLQDATNEGWLFEGRDDYMNNGFYYSGWSYHNINMGIPLYHTGKVFKHYAKSILYNDHGIFYNNRVNGAHLGAEGQILKNLSYRTKLTYTINKGAYAEEFHDRYSWERTENYFFKESKNQFYTMVEAIWRPKFIMDVEIQTQLSLDFGELYDSFGGRVVINYTPKL